MRIEGGRRARRLNKGREEESQRIEGGKRGREPEDGKEGRCQIDEDDLEKEEE